MVTERCRFSLRFLPVITAPGRARIQSAQGWSGGPGRNAAGAGPRGKAHGRRGARGRAKSHPVWRSKEGTKALLVEAAVETAVGSPEGEARLVGCTGRRSCSGGCNGGRSCPLAKMSDRQGAVAAVIPPHILRAVRDVLFPSAKGRVFLCHRLYVTA